MKVYEGLACQLRAAGVDAVFGVMGDGNMHWLASYLRLPGARWYPAWHEAGALGMADGYATAAALAGKSAVGVATVTMGPGVAQSLAALTAAVRTRSRLLVITAEAAHTSPQGTQDVDQRAWAETAGAAYRLATGPADVATALAEVLASAEAGEPAVLALPVGLMTVEIEEPSPDGSRPHRGNDGVQPGPSADLRHYPAPDPVAVQATARLLAESQRPLVLLGRGAILGRAVQAAVDVGRKAGACFLTTVAANGCLAPFGDPFELGLTGTMAHPTARALAATADVVLVVGAALDSHNTAGGSFFVQAKLARIDCRPSSHLWHPGGDIVDITADAAAAVALLSEQLPAEPRPGLRTSATADLLTAEPARRARLAAAEAADGLNPWAVIAALDDAVDDRAHIVTGVGHFWYFAAPYMSGRAGRTFHFGHGFGLIGQGIPLATGAAVTSPPPVTAGGPVSPEPAKTTPPAAARRSVVAIEGDGSFMMNAQELQSAVRFGADLLVVVLNNEAYGSEYHKLGIAGLDPSAGTFEQPADITAIARALGAQARRVRTLAELRSGLAAFVGSQGGVRVLDIAVARSVMSEAYERMHLPAATATIAEVRP